LSAEQVLELAWQNLETQTVLLHEAARAFLADKAGALRNISSPRVD